MHNISVSVNGSPQKVIIFREITEKFGDLQELTLISECETRWNSTFHMLNRAIYLEKVLNFNISTKYAV